MNARNEKKTAEIPEFTVVFERKRFGTDGCRAQTMVLAIETKTEDEYYLKTLMRKSSVQCQL